MLFDLDGTLVDLRWLHWRALNRALAEAGYSPITIEEHISTYDGLPTSRKLALLGVPEWLCDTVNSRKQAYTMALIREEVVPDERLLEEIEQIKTKCFIGVVSNALNGTCVAVMMRSGLGPYVDMLIAGPHEKPKPDPAPYTKALEAAHLDSLRTIAVEDNHYGIEAAEKAGLRCLRVAGPKDITYEFVIGGFHATQAQFAGFG